MPPTNVLRIPNLALNARAAQARPQTGSADGSSSLFGGLQTPPATPDADLDHRLEKLAVSSSGGDLQQHHRHQHQHQPITRTTTSPLPSPVSTPAAVEPPQQQQWPPIIAVVPSSSSSSSSSSSYSSSPPAASASAVEAAQAEPETAAAPGMAVVEEEEEGNPAFRNGGVVDPQARGFRFFPLLPAELRIRVWELSFEPRVVELHTRRLHYADDFRHGGHIYWHSQCANPAALSVSLEAREVALARYSVAVPLAVAPQGRGREVAGDSVADLHHRLYLDPASDTVALLGELDLSLLRSLFEVVRQADPTGRGVRRLGVSAACFKHQGLLSMYAKTVFRDIDELVLFMYVWPMPPERWSQGLCVLEDCADKDFFRRWEMTVGKHFKTPDGQWLKVGKANREIRIMDLLFLPRGYL